MEGEAVGPRAGPGKARLTCRERVVRQGEMEWGRHGAGEASVTVRKTDRQGERERQIDSQSGLVHAGALVDHN